MEPSLDEAYHRDAAPCGGAALEDAGQVLRKELAAEAAAGLQAVMAREAAHGR